MEPLITQNRQATWAWAAAFLFVAVSYLFLYAFVHESGHALVGMIFGQRLVAFHVNIFTLNAYVSLDGPLTPAQRILQTLAGHGLPLALWALWMLFVPRGGDVVLLLLKAVSSISMLGSTAVWVIIPLLYGAGKAPVGDDVTNMLDASQISPLGAAGLAALILALMAGLAWVKNQGVIRDLRRHMEMLELGKVESRNQLALPRSSRTLLIQGILTGTALLLLAGMQWALPGRDEGALGVRDIPNGYHFETGIHLDQASSQDRTIAEFSLSEPGSAGVFIQVHAIHSPSIEIVLEGTDGFQQVLLAGKDYQATLDSARYDVPIPAGEYRVVLTHQLSPGRVEVYLLDR